MKSFKRINLKKGESESVEFTIASENLKVVDINGDRVWRKGDYRIVVGNSSPGELSVERGAAQPQEAIITLK